MASVELIVGGVKQGTTSAAIKEFVSVENSLLFCSEMCINGIDELLEYEKLPKLLDSQKCRLLDTPFEDLSFAAICRELEIRKVKNSVIVIDGYMITETSTLADIKNVAMELNVDFKITVKASMNAPKELQRVFL